MTKDTEQPQQSKSEAGATLPERIERKRTPAEQDELNRLAQAETHDARELSRADTVAGIGKAEAAIRTMQAEKMFIGKCPENHSVERIAKAFAALGKTVRKTVGMAGMIAAAFGALELSKFTTLSALAAPLEKSSTAQETVQTKGSRISQECVRSLDVLRDLTAPQDDKDKALDRLLDSAKDHPQDFITFLLGSYQSVNQEQYHEQDGRTFSTDWSLSASDMQRALEDLSFGKKNALELMQSLVDKSHDVRIGFSENGQIILMEYPSQAYHDAPRPESVHVFRRDVIFNTTMSGYDYAVRGVIRYDDTGKPFGLFVEARAKNAHPFESDSLHAEHDERIALLSPEFKNEYARYQHGETGSRTFGEYARPGRELIEQIRVLGQLESRGLDAESQLVAQKIAENMHAIERGEFSGDIKAEGKGFFDYSKFPERVQQELARELPGTEQLVDVVKTRGGVALHQFERDITAKAREMMAQ